jgi:hypothetical protein
MVPAATTPWRHAGYLGCARSVARPGTLGYRGCRRRCTRGRRCDTDCSAVHKCGVGCGNSWPRSDELFVVIGISNWEHDKVRDSDFLQCALKHQYEEETPMRVPLTYPAGGYNIGRVRRDCGENAHYGVIM